MHLGIYEREENWPFIYLTFNFLNHLNTQYVDKPNLSNLRVS